MSTHDIDINFKISRQVDTHNELKQALWNTRQEDCGISIEEIAGIIKKEFDEAEVEALVKELKN